MKISVITVSYNSATTLADTLESVLKQDYRDYEYLVIDGGSTDGTVEILKEYEPRFEGRMKWISEKDKGMYDGINKGIRMASGDVVGLIHSDDFYHRTDILSIVNRSFEENQDIQAIYGDIRFVNPGDLDTTVRYYSSRKFRPWMFRWGWMPAHPTYFTYKENFEKYGYYRCDYQITADFELMLRHLYKHRIPARYIPVDFMKMRTGGRSTSGWKSTLVINKEDLRACRENGIYTNLPMLYMRYFVKVFELFTPHHQ